MKQPILLPKFGRKSGGSDVDRPESIPDVSIGVGAETEIIQTEALTSPKRGRVGFFQNFGRQGGGEKTGDGLVQSELSLERVQVVRNDLSGAAMKGTPLGQERAKERTPKAQWWWTRLQRRLFARGRKQD